MDPFENKKRNVSTLSDYLHQEKTFRSDRETYFSTLFSLSWALMVLGAVENIIVCCVLATGKIGRSPTKLSKFFVLHLAITDLVYRAITFLGRTIDRKNLYSSSTVHCQLAIFSQFTCAAVTFVLLTGIAIDRYIHILFPLRALTIKTRKHFIIIFIWVYALGLSAVLQSPIVSGNFVVNVIFFQILHHTLSKTIQLVQILNCSEDTVLLGNRIR